MYTRLKHHLASPGGRRFTAGTGFILAALLASLSLFATGPNPEPDVRTEKAWPVSVVRVTPRPMRPTFTAYGRVESRSITHLKTDLNARVTDVHVREGDWVEAGDVLLTLDDAELRLILAERRAEVRQLEARLASIRLEQGMLEEATGHYRSMQEVAEKKYRRHQDLMAKRMISQALLDEVTAQASQASIAFQSHMRALADFPNRLAAARAVLAQAQAQLRRTELNMGKTRVAAPFRGPILGVFVAPGDRSMIGATLVDIASADAFEVRVQIPRRYSASLLANQPPGGAVTASTDSGLVLRLSRVSGRIRPGQSGLDAFFEFSTEQGGTHAALGRLLELSVSLPEEPAVVALPVQSLYQNDRIYTLRAVPGPAGQGGAARQNPEYRLEAVTVERVGEARNAEGQYRILVRAPQLRPGARVITTQLPRAVSGLLVEPA